MAQSRESSERQEMATQEIDSPPGMTPRLIPLANLEGLAAAGLLYPSTEHDWRWLYRCRRERGLDEAFHYTVGSASTAAITSALPKSDCAYP